MEQCGGVRRVGRRLSKDIQPFPPSGILATKESMLWFPFDHSSSFQAMSKPTYVHNILQQASVFSRSRPWRGMTVGSTCSGIPSVCTSRQRIILQLISWNVISFELQMISPSVFPSRPCFASVQISFSDFHQTFPIRDGTWNLDHSTHKPDLQYALFCSG